jgi:hypothetical protein
MAIQAIETNENREFLRAFGERKQLLKQMKMANDYYNYVTKTTCTSTTLFPT